MQLLRNHTSLLVVVGLFIASMIFINPLRNTAMQDDWAYARTVQHLIDTGDYRLDVWLSANMPFLAFWGAAFSRVFGYSHSTLRLSTLVLEFLGLVACYRLAKIYDFSNWQAGLLVLVLFVSPVVFQLSYSFMTDVPLMALLFIGLYFYTLALKQQSSVLAFAGSFAAAAAILTRQFGVALLIGWGAAWLFDPMRWRGLKRYAIGAVLPAAAAVWQLYIGGLHPNFAASYTFDMQRAFLTQPPLHLAGELLWRILVVVLYLALFVGPLAIVALLSYAAWLRRPGLGRRLIIALYLSAMAVGATVFLSSQRPYMSVLMPYLPWNLFVSGWAQVFVTTVTFICGVLLLPLLVKRIREFSRAALHEKLLYLAAFFSFVLIIVFFQIGDEYLLVLMPFALFAVGTQIRDQLSRYGWLVIPVSIVGLVLVAFFTRYQLAASEAEWRAADAIFATGIPEREISVYWTWNAYHDAFDDYVASKEGSLLNAFSDYFVWQSERHAQADYVVTRNPERESGEVIYTVISDEHAFRPQEIYVVQRDAPAP